jgi:hypothetical protein
MKALLLNEEFLVKTMSRNSNNSDTQHSLTRVRARTPLPFGHITSGFSPRLISTQISQKIVSQEIRISGSK